MRNQINYFLHELNNTIEFTETTSGYIHNKVLGYYSILYSSIQSKYTNLEYQTSSSNNAVSGAINNLYTKIVEETKNTILDMISELHSKIKEQFNLTNILKNCLRKTKLGKLMEKQNKTLKFEKSFKHEFPIMFPPFPNFQLRFTPDMGLFLGFFASINPNWEELKFRLEFEVYMEAYVALKFEGGFYVPCSTQSPVKTAFTIGFDGVIGHGIAGMRLEIYINEFDITFDLYFKGKALSFEFYCQARVEIKTFFFESEYTYDFFRTKLLEYETEHHTSNKVPKKYEGSKNFHNVFGNSVHNNL